MLPEAIGSHSGMAVACDTMTDDTVPLRDRDSMLQERVAISDLDRIVSEKVDLRALLKRL